MKNVKSVILLLAVASISLLVGCGGGGGGGNSYYYSGDESYSTDSSTYYNSANSNIRNLYSPYNTFSAYNGQTTLPLNITLDSSKEVIYACQITNPNSQAITNLTITPPLGYNTRASQSDETNGDEEEISPLANTIIPFRENIADKLKLKEELYNKYLENEAKNKSLSIRANTSHLNEVEGQKDIAITVLNKSRRCTLAKVSAYAKLFIDQDSDGSVAAPNITSSSINQFAEEFDNYVYPILKENFGNGSDVFWRDIDNDGKLSIVFSPVVNNYGKSVVGIFDSANMNSSNPRDMICVGVKRNSDSTYEKWFMDARETIPHEMQHIVNFSAKKNLGQSTEITWIDEGLAVCAEILYRKKRSEAGLTSYSLYYGRECTDFPGNDARFYYAVYYKPEVRLTDFETYEDQTALAHYGQKGLFFYYLFEQYGKEQLRQLCQGARGIEKFNSLDRSLGQLFIDFNFAVLNEMLRNNDMSKYAVSYDAARNSNSRQVFQTNLNLNLLLTSGSPEISNSYIERKMVNLNSTRTINALYLNNQASVLPANGGTIRFLLKQPNIKGASYQITINSSSSVTPNPTPVVVNMTRISQ